jgi:hypothetical protein
VKEWAWVRIKKGGDNYVRPFVYELLIGSGWGNGSRVVSEHTDQAEAQRLAIFFNKQVEAESDTD